MVVLRSVVTELVTNETPTVVLRQTMSETSSMDPGAPPARSIPVSQARMRSRWELITNWSAGVPLLPNRQRMPVVHSSIRLSRLVIDVALAKELNVHAGAAVADQVLRGRQGVRPRQRETRQPHAATAVEHGALIDRHVRIERVIQDDFDGIPGEVGETAGPHLHIGRNGAGRRTHPDTSGAVVEVVRSEQSTDIAAAGALVVEIDRNAAKALEAVLLDVRLRDCARANGCTSPAP